MTEREKVFEEFIQLKLREQMIEEDWINRMDTGKGWIPQLREELVKEKGSALLLIPIFLEAIVNLERRVYELEMQERIRKGEI